MELLVLLVIFLLVGYVLADSKLGRRVDQAAEGVAATSRNWADSVEGRWRSLFRRRSLADAFQDWATGPSSGLSDDVVKWLTGLSGQEAQDFTQALAEYAHGLGFSLETLVDGGLDQEPILRQVFVEAIVVYSDAYRKARKALQEAEQAQAKADQETPPTDGKKPAEKQASRRKREPVEAAETASVA